MITLYLKTHNKTGLKYLGKTEKDLKTYKGSGVYWKNHIKKHGNDVTTKILYQSKSKEKIRDKGLYYSKKYNVVASKEFANLMEENGIGGVNSGSFKKGNKPWNAGKTCENISKYRKEYWIKWRLDNPNYKDNWKKRIKKGNSGQIRNGKVIAQRLNSTIISCPHCSKKGNVGNMKRWHFDNCNGHN